MESDPTRKYEVTPGCPEVGGALIQLAGKNGWAHCVPLDSNGHTTADAQRLILNSDANTVGWNTQSYPDKYELISVERAVKVLQQQKRLRIGEHLVEFHRDTIKVGCVHVTIGTVDEIYNRLHREDEE